MTYLTTTAEYDLDDSDEIDEADVVAPVTSAFSALEWSVIALAQRDRVADLREPGRLASAVASLFGSSRPNRLADERLEALRRVAVWAWHHGYALPVAELRAFLATGFSNEQYEMLQTSVARGRPTSRNRRA